MRIHAHKHCAKWLTALLPLAAGIALPCSAQKLPPRKSSVTSTTQPLRSEEVAPLETRLFAQKRWMQGVPASLRIVVQDHRTGSPLRADVEITLGEAPPPPTDKKPGAKKVESIIPRTTAPSRIVHMGSTDALGTVSAQINTASLPPGNYRISVLVTSPIGKDRIDEAIQIVDAARLMLTSDKPVYQPSQIIHLRVLATDQGTRSAVSERPIIFEVEDAKGNKVFKKRDRLSSFGIASADFELADEVNMGLFTLRAILKDDAGEAKVEKKVRVDQYVLPKFKLGMKFEKPYYMPGGIAHGTVQAGYLFGKPVSNGSVSVSLVENQTGAAPPRTIPILDGKTDKNGSYSFDYRLPREFMEQTLEQGKTFVEFSARVLDTAGHFQETASKVLITRDPIQITVIPESRALVAGVPNRLIISAATVEGSPLRNIRLSMECNTDNRTVHTTTDSLGLAAYEVRPGNEPVVISVTAMLQNGREVTVHRRLQAAALRSGILLQPSKTLVHIGDKISLTIFAPENLQLGENGVYLDAVRGGQTILTRAAALEKGRATIPLVITEDMAGKIELHAYRILPSDEIVRDTRTIIVQSANDLKIDVAANQTVYRPGTEAVLRFSLKDRQKHPVVAALGINIVDESVYALMESNPGLEMLALTLEKELLTPRAEILGPTYSDILSEADLPNITESQRQRAATYILASLPPSPGFDIKVNTYQSRWTKLRLAVIEEMARAHRNILLAMQEYRRSRGLPISDEQGVLRLVDNGFLHRDDLIDHWGNPYHITFDGDPRAFTWMSINSAGPDERWDTVDDIKGITLLNSPKYSYLRGGTGRGGAMGGGGFGSLGGGVGGGGGGGYGGGSGGGGFGGGYSAPNEEKPVIDGRTDTIGAQPASKPDTDSAAQEPRIRELFPETLYWNPSVITDDQGLAELHIPIADSITSWRLNAMGNTPAGLLGSATRQLQVFQDFFIDIDAPLFLTRKDVVELPVSLYNYNSGAQTVTLTLEQQPWFTPEGPVTSVVKLEKDQVTVVYFPIRVNAAGRHTLTVTARGSRLSDVVRRTINVLPDGKPQELVINDRVNKSAKRTVQFPASALPGNSSIMVKLYPSAFSQIVEGLDGILRMPYGCFEQTTSATYPNVMVLSYLKQIKKVSPELQMKAESYINTGYQRLVTFEVKGGGFSLYGAEPARLSLTAYGLLEFSDMSKVHDVDPALIQRTQAWLVEKQSFEGSWREKESWAGASQDPDVSELRITAYVGWALAESGYRGAPLDRTARFIREHRKNAKDPYTLALVLNFLASISSEGDLLEQTSNALAEQARTATGTEKSAYWRSDTSTYTGAYGLGADLETTGLAAYGLLRAGRHIDMAANALTFLTSHRTSAGAWPSTQSTIWAMKALIAAGPGIGGAKGTVTVFTNDTKAASFTITPEDSDVMRQIDLKEYVLPGENSIRLDYSGEGSILYQIVGKYYIPWTDAPPPAAEGSPLSIRVGYDRVAVLQGETCEVTVTVTNNGSREVAAPLIDLGVPPGFTVLTDKLDRAVSDKAISKYSVAGRQILVYLDRLLPQQTITLHYDLRARYPVRAETLSSMVYPYYNPEQAAVSAPQTIQVKK
jgi:hypothetical protein